MLTELGGVVESGVAVVGKVLHTIEVALSVGASAVGTFGREVAELVGVDIVHIEYCRQSQTLQYGVASLSRCEGACYSAAVGIYLVLFNKGHVVEFLDAFVVRSVLVVYGHRRSERKLERMHRVAIVLCSGQRLLLGEREDAAQGEVEVLVFVVDVEMAAVSFKTRVACHTLLIGIVDRCGETCVLAAAHYGEVVVLLQRFSEQSLLPVGIASSRTRGIIVDYLLGMFLSPLHSLTRIDIGIDKTLKHQVASLLASHCRAVAISHVAYAETCLEIVCGLALRGLLGGDEHNAVGATCTVERG